MYYIQEGDSGQVVADGLKQNFDELQTNKINDAPSDGKRYVRQNSNWIEENSIDTTSFATKTEVNENLSKKQDKLISGTNIKTINGESILDSGNIEIQKGIEVIDVSFFVELQAKYIEKGGVQLTSEEVLAIIGGEEGFNALSAKVETGVFGKLNGEMQQYASQPETKMTIHAISPMIKVISNDGAGITIAGNFIIGGLMLGTDGTQYFYAWDKI